MTTHPRAGRLHTGRRVWLLASHDMGRKVAILAITAGAYAVGFWPSAWVRVAVLKAFGNPAYKGVWILIPHVFLYTTLSALTCLVLWVALIRLKWLQPIPFAVSRSVVIWGVTVGIVSAVAAFGVFAGLQPGAVYAARFNPWVATANLFSNFYEEFIFRGALFTRLARLLGAGWGIVLSGISFGLLHTATETASDTRGNLLAGAALAILLQGVGGVGFAIVLRRTRNLLASSIIHVISNVAFG